MTRVLMNGSTDGVFQALAVRAYDHFLNAMGGDHSRLKDNIYMAIAIDRSLVLSPIVRQLEQKLIRAKPKSRSFREIDEYLGAIDNAAFMAYAWAKQEETLNARRLAAETLAAKARSAEAGAKSGVARQKKAENTWRPIAFEMATRIRKEEPKASQQEVASKIDFGWTSVTPRAPGHVTLTKFVAEMESLGRLPKRSSNESGDK